MNLSFGYLTEQLVDAFNSSSFAFWTVSIDHHIFLGAKSTKHNPIDRQFNPEFSDIFL